MQCFLKARNPHSSRIYCHGREVSAISDLRARCPRKHQRQRSGSGPRSRPRATPRHRPARSGAESGGSCGGRTPPQTLGTGQHPRSSHHPKTGRYLVKLFQAVLSSDTGLFNVIINSVQDCALAIKTVAGSQQPRVGQWTQKHTSPGPGCPRRTARWERGAHQPAASGRRAACGVGCNEV